MSIAMNGMLASRYFEAMAGAITSSVWNSITRSTCSLDQVVRAAQRDLRLVAVVHHDQFDVLPLGRPRQSGPDLAVERGVLALRGVSDPVQPPAAHLRRQAVVILADLVQKPALVQRVEQAEAHPLVEAGPRAPRRADAAHRRTTGTPPAPAKRAPAISPCTGCGSKSSPHYVVTVTQCKTQLTAASSCRSGRKSATSTTTRSDRTGTAAATPRLAPAASRKSRFRSPPRGPRPAFRTVPIRTRRTASSARSTASSSSSRPSGRPPPRLGSGRCEQQNRGPVSDRQGDVAAQVFQAEWQAATPSAPLRPTKSHPPEGPPPELRRSSRRWSLRTPQIPDRQAAMPTTSGRKSAAACPPAPAG